MSLREEIDHKKNVNEFIMALPKLEPSELIGLAKILCVKVFDNEHLDENNHPVPREGTKIIEDMVNSFSSLNRAKRREILRILRPIAKG